MITDELIIYPLSEYVNDIRELVKACVEDLELNMVPIVAFLPDAPAQAIPSDTRCVILPDSLSVQTAEGVRKLTYSIDSTKGDICVLNIQKRTNCTCFEVLYGVFMSRVFIPLESKFSPDQVVLAIIILCGLGASIDKLIPLINEKIK